jgi:hypothetical protein
METLFGTNIHVYQFSIEKAIYALKQLAANYYAHHCIFKWRRVQQV